MGAGSSKDPPPASPSPAGAGTGTPHILCHVGTQLSHCPSGLLTLKANLKSEIKVTVALPRLLSLPEDAHVKVSTSRWGARSL